MATPSSPTTPHFGAGAAASAAFAFPAASRADVKIAAAPFRFTVQLFGTSVVLPAEIAAAGAPPSVGEVFDAAFAALQQHRSAQTQTNTAYVSSPRDFELVDRRSGRSLSAQRLSSVRDAGLVSGCTQLVLVPNAKAGRGMHRQLEVEVDAGTLASMAGLPAPGSAEAQAAAREQRRQTRRAQQQQAAAAKAAAEEATLVAQYQAGQLRYSELPASLQQKLAQAHDAQVRAGDERRGRERDNDRHRARMDELMDKMRRRRDKRKQSFARAAAAAAAPDVSAKVELPPSPTAAQQPAFADRQESAAPAAAAAAARKLERGVAGVPSFAGLRPGFLCAAPVPKTASQPKAASAAGTAAKPADSAAKQQTPPGAGSFGGFKRGFLL